jgi:predicted molibdopterin-dependent oxidoreductase YjgC
MFRTQPEPGAKTVDVEIDGTVTPVQAGWSVAAALLASGGGPTRQSPVGGAPRAPYCMMGVCFECLVEIDGVPNRQACLVPVAAGMKVCRTRGVRGVGPL